jgi:hypothetical protein
MQLILFLPHSSHGKTIRGELTLTYRTAPRKRLPGRRAVGTAVDVYDLFFARGIRNGMQFFSFAQFRSAERTRRTLCFGRFCACSRLPQGNVLLFAPGSCQRQHTDGYNTEEDDDKYRNIVCSLIFFVAACAPVRFTSCSVCNSAFYFKKSFHVLCGFFCFFKLVISFSVTHR